MRFARAVSVALAAAAAVLLRGAPAAAAPATFTDVICPAATQYVIAAGKLRVDDSPDRIYAAAQAAADAYALCSKEKLSHGYREAQHYADTRGAGFSVVAARALIALNRLDEARRELVQARAFAQQVVDWHFETEAYNSADVNGFAVTINADPRRRSMYWQSAKEIVDSADQALEEIDRLTGRRQASPPRAPAAQPTPAH
jgi:hypothetical protein